LIIIFFFLPNAALPTLLSYNVERMRIRSLEAEVDSLRRQVELLTSELTSLTADDRSTKLGPIKRRSGSGAGI